MNNSKYNAGDKVAYKSKSPAGIDMKITTVVGLQSEKENPWEIKYSAKYGRPGPVKAKNPRKEKVYVIAHYFGWYPHTQESLSKELRTKPNMRYYYAFESELSPTKVEQKV